MATVPRTPTPVRSTTPLPNLLYQRDTSCWIYGGVSVNAMAMPARIRETVNDEAIYRWQLHWYQRPGWRLWITED